MPAARALLVSGDATWCRLREAPAVARRLESAATRGAAALVEHMLTVAEVISRRVFPARADGSAESDGRRFGRRLDGWRALDVERP